MGGMETRPNSANKIKVVVVRVQPSKSPDARDRRIFHETLAQVQITASALLFDMDGVLINSTPAVARVWRRWALEHGFDPEEVVTRAHGRPSLATVREYLPHADHEKENREVERREMTDLEGVVPLADRKSVV